MDSSFDLGRLVSYLESTDETNCAFDNNPGGMFQISELISELGPTASCPERTPEYLSYRRRVLNDAINEQLSCISGQSNVKDANLREMARLAIKLTEKKKNA